jgi:hypothetical protein
MPYPERFFPVDGGSWQERKDHIHFEVSLHFLPANYMNKITALVALSLIPIIAHAQDLFPVYHVKYVTGENAYLDAGGADSLAVGDTLLVSHDDSVVARIEIAFAAEHSSSCKILNGAGEINAGDIVRPARKGSQSRVTAAALPIDTAEVEAPQRMVAVQPPAKTSSTRIYGGAAFRLYRVSDHSPANLDFTQPSLRINLRATRLFGQDITLKILSDSRYNARNRSYGGGVPENEWRNRFYQFSISYSDERSPYHFEAGRIISNDFSGIGYIDGVLAQRKLGENFRFGGFGGTQPQWQYSDFQTSLQKYGAFGTLTIGDYRRGRFESTVALAGEYHGPTVSREFVFLRNTLNMGRIWDFYQSSELDMNRAWRKAKTGQNLSLTNLYLSVRGRLARWLQTGLSFDSRKNYWTFETRSLADSLFDDYIRRGLRADLIFRPGRTLSINTNFGYHKRSADTRGTYSGGAGINMNNFFSARQFLNIQAAGFRSLFANGYNGSVTLGRYLWAGNMFSLVYGVYGYDFSGAGKSRLNRWIQANGRFDLVKKTYLLGAFEYDTGDDTDANRITGEIGYRF